jgi:hypothetical protein
VTSAASAAARGSSDLLTVVIHNIYSYLGIYVSLL